jgi:Bacterial membrane protein YfhO
LSMTAVVNAWSQSEVKLFTTVAAGGFLYSLGFHNVFQGLLYAAFPFVDRARTPAMAIVIFGFGAAVLAAYGVDQLRVLRGAGFLRPVMWGLAGFGLLIWFVAYCILLAKAFAWPGDDRVIMTALLAVLAAGLLFGWQKGKVADRNAAVLLTALMLTELANASGLDFADRNDYIRSSPLHAIRGNSDVADFLGRQPRPFRVDIDSDELPPNWPEYNNFDQMKAAGANPANWAQLEPQSWQTRSLFDVQFTIGRATSIPGATPVFEGASGIKVFRNPQAFPRAWAVHETIVMTKPSDAQELIRNHLEDLHSKVFVSLGPTVRESCATGDTVAVTRHDAAHVTIRAIMACDGMVVLSDTFYPGWTATVDKKAAEIQEVNFAMRGVAVPRGMHEINYSYRPAMVYAGAVMSATGVLGSCLIVFFDRRRRHAIDLEPKRANNQS